MIPAADLYLGHFSLADAPARARFEAAAAAGFLGVSVEWREVTARGEAGVTPGAIRRELADLGLRTPQLEIIPLPARDQATAFRLLAARIAGAAAELGCDVVHAAALSPDLTFDDLTVGFATLAEACAGQGVACGVEFVPFLTPVPDLGEALRLVRAIGASGAGVVLDSLHFFRCGAPWAELEGVDPAEIVAIQINDAPTLRPTEDYRREAMGLRLLPGRGELDLMRYLDVLDGLGVTVPLTVEVVNTALSALGPHAAAEAMAGATRDLLGRRAARAAAA